jgi:hypothetical protein
MGVFALPAVQWAIVGLTAAGAVYSQRQAAGAQEVELQMQKRGEATAAQDREIQRKRRLNAILGTQAAEAAAGGLSMSGSVANISLTDARRASEESMIDSVASRQRIDALSRQQRTVRRLSNVRTASTLLNAASSAGRIGYTGASSPSTTGTNPQTYAGNRPSPGSRAA